MSMDAQIQFRSGLLVTAERAFPADEVSPHFAIICIAPADTPRSGATLYFFDTDSVDTLIAALERTRASLAEMDPATVPVGVLPEYNSMPATDEIAVSEVPLS